MFFQEGLIDMFFQDGLTAARLPQGDVVSRCLPSRRAGDLRYALQDGLFGMFLLDGPAAARLSQGDFVFKVTDWALYAALPLRAFVDMLGV
jgi:hypothetical protein